MRTNVYVDAFNLYYSCLKQTPYRWLDLQRLSTLMLPTHNIQRVRYFTALVHERPEKPGQNVNLATYLLADGFRNDYEAAVIISNDSDLLEPIRLVRDELRRVVGILNPQARPSRALLPHVTFIKQIRPGVLAASQFPRILTDAQGSFHKPHRW